MGNTLFSISPLPSLVPWRGNASDTTREVTVVTFAEGEVPDEPLTMVAWSYIKSFYVYSLVTYTTQMHDHNKLCSSCDQS